MKHRIWAVVTDIDQPPLLFSSEAEADQWRKDIAAEHDDEECCVGSYLCDTPEGFVHIDPRELATVLAALRWWQHLEEKHPQIPFVNKKDREGTHFEDHDPLTANEIDALCERLNCK